MLLLPSEGNWDNPSSVLGNLQESRLSQIEVLERGVAPATIVIREGKVGRAKVGCRDHDGPWEAPPGVVIAPHLVAWPAAQAVVEQGSAQSCSVGAIALAVQVAIPTSTSWKFRTIYMRSGT